MQPFDRYLLVKRRHDRRTARARSAARRRERRLIGFGALVGLFAAALLMGAAWLYTGVTANLPNPALLETLLDPAAGPLLQPTRIYDRSGQHLLASLDNPGVPRRYLSIDPETPEHIEPLLVHAFVALHDPTFWSDPGVRLDRLTDPRPVTLAEKLVSDLLLWAEPDGWQKTVRMRLLAAQVVQTYDHSQVLEWVLNSASFGHRAYGVDSAARLYLGKPATRLTLAEAALLAAISETPALNPLDAPAAVRELQPLALRRMVNAGQISEADYQLAAAEQLVFAPAPLRYATEATPPTGAPAAAFTNLVIQQLSAHFDRDWIERGGLQIVTTLDAGLQRQLTCTLQAQLAGGPAHRPAGSDCDAARLLP
ncbi:MAG TPA: transglycosylase domain-containing protein, partial [Anaerolineaceae bacterium]|nr:transglycosylase domain-containing protein [Anaerolineaceae bacterium]